MKFFRWHRYRDVDEEIQQHLRMATRDRIERGETPQEADRQSRRELGNIALVKEVTRNMSYGAIFDQILQDLRYAIRILAKNRGFTVVAILSLTLGIGASAAIFQLLDVVTLRMLPVRQPEELAEIRITNRHGISANYLGRRAVLSYPLWEQVRQNVGSPSGEKIFSGVFAFGDDTFDLSSGGEARNVQAMWASGDLFNVLGVQPMIGRLFNSRDDEKGCGSPAAIISYRFWQSEYGRDLSVIGKTISLEGKPFEIIGVTPASFYGVESGRNFDVAVPLCAEPIIYRQDSKIESRSDFWLAAIGRLKPGVTVQQASAELTAASPAIFQET
ncbi:MAG TPA: ABC transporter permease, partial [Blastocatellia bacterium]|nr:ABC transporter permease [Blastocatellia bacterium]